VLDAALLAAFASDRRASWREPVRDAACRLLRRVVAPVPGSPTSSLASRQPVSRVAGHDNMVGHCVNALPLRFDVEPSQSFAQSLDGAQATLLDAPGAPALHLRDVAQEARAFAATRPRMPLLSVLFNLRPGPRQGGHRFPGLAMEFD
jgi:hypothetical protein